MRYNLNWQISNFTVPCIRRTVWRQLPRHYIELPEILSCSKQITSEGSQSFPSARVSTAPYSRPAIRFGTHKLRGQTHTPVDRRCELSHLTHGRHSTTNAVFSRSNNTFKFTRHCGQKTFSRRLLRLLLLIVLIPPKTPEVILFSQHSHSFF